MKLLNKLKDDRQNLINSLLDNIKSLERIAFEQQAEIERLEQFYDDMQDAIYSFREDHVKVKFFKKEIETKAIKEFAERLKEKKSYYIETDNSCKWFKGVSADDIDNLVKEMTEQ